jgi:hypothetical protein
MKAIKGGKRMGILNLTPHDVVIIKEDNKKIVIPRSGYILRASVSEIPAGKVSFHGEQIPVVEQTLGHLVLLDSERRELSKREIENLFEGVEAVIVPTLLKDYKKEFFDLIGGFVFMYAPNTAKAIRDEHGKIVGVPSLVAL